MDDGQRSLFSISASLFYLLNKTRTCAKPGRLTNVPVARSARTKVEGERRFLNVGHGEKDLA